MASLAQLSEGREALMAARYPGFRSVEYDGMRVGYATDVKMAAALGDLNRQITATGPQRSAFPSSTSKPDLRLSMVAKDFA